MNAPTPRDRSRTPEAKAETLHRRALRQAKYGTHIAHAPRLLREGVSLPLR